MKLNQKILKAINEGIRKSLLSFNEVEFDQSDSNIINQKVTKTIKDQKFIQENFVDLGLESGTLWCMWNLGATNENTPESWYGDYYAWGETNTKDDYTGVSYTYMEKPEILPFDHDIAYLTNNLMHMPTRKQIEELSLLPNKWVENYNKIKGLNGALFTGTNGNELFLPAAGWFNGTNLNYAGSCCSVWTKSPNIHSINSVWYLFFNQHGKRVAPAGRPCGLSVRSVVG